MNIGDIFKLSEEDMYWLFMRKNYESNYTNGYLLSTNEIYNTNPKIKFKDMVLYTVNDNNNYMTSLEIYDGLTEYIGTVEYSEFAKFCKEVYNKNLTKTDDSDLLIPGTLYSLAHKNTLFLCYARLNKGCIGYEFSFKDRIGKITYLTDYFAMYKKSTFVIGKLTSASEIDHSMLRDISLICKEIYFSDELLVQWFCQDLDQMKYKTKCMLELLQKEDPIYFNSHILIMKGDR